MWRYNALAELIRAHSDVRIIYIILFENIEIATAARQRSNKEVCFVFLTSDRIKVRNRAACPINLHGFAWLVCRAHRSLRNMSSAAVLVAELRTHEWLFTVCVGSFTVLLPEQRERDTLLGQFAVDVLVVDDCIGNSAPALFAVEQLIQHLVRHIIIERPCDVQFSCAIKCRFTV